MNIMLVPQGSAVNMVLVPHKHFVEMVGFVNLLDEQTLFFAMEHLKLALLHHPCRAALLEMIASKHALSRLETPAPWNKVLDGITQLTKFALVMSSADLELSRIAHDRRALLKVFASRRAAVEWIEQTDLPRAPAIPPARRTKKLANWLFT